MASLRRTRFFEALKGRVRNLSEVRDLLGNWNDEDIKEEVQPCEVHERGRNTSKRYKRCKTDGKISRNGMNAHEDMKLK